MTKTLTGKVMKWDFPGPAEGKRQYALLSVAMEELLGLCKAHYYNAVTGKGEQRMLVDSHVRKLTQELLAGKFTPATISLSLYREHNKNLVLNGQDFVLQVEENKPLPLTDGGHRLAALGRVIDILREENKTEAIEDVMRLPIPVMLYLDGDPQKDFARLQEGRAVDKAQLMSLRIQKLEKDPVMKLAFDIAKELDKKKDSPFLGRVRFDTHGDTGNIPVTTLCSKGASDIGTSLVGSAKIMMFFDRPKSTGYVSEMFIDMCKLIEKEAPVLFEQAKVLTPPNKHGTKGAATMLIGVLNCLLYRVEAFNKEVMDKEEANHLIDSLTSSMDIEVQKSFSSQLKREYLGFFARDYLADLGNLSVRQMHDGLPIELCNILSYSTFQAEPPEGKRGRGRPRKQNPESAEEKEIEPEPEKV